MLYAKLIAQPEEGQSLPWALRAGSLHGFAVNWPPQLFQNKESAQGVVFGKKAEVQASEDPSSLP